MRMSESSTDCYKTADRVRKKKKKNMHKTETSLVPPFQLCVIWNTCVTRGSRSLSTVRVRISRLLGSHFSRMGEVAVVMVSVGWQEKSHWLERLKGHLHETRYDNPLKKNKKQVETHHGWLRAHRYMGSTFILMNPFWKKTCFFFFLFNFSLQGRCESGLWVSAKLHAQLSPSSWNFTWIPYPVLPFSFWATAF